LIAANRRGGVRTREATAVVVTGSVLADNGEPTSPAGTGSPVGGGAELVAAAVRFVGNTLVDNRARRPRATRRSAARATATARRLRQQPDHERVRLRCDLPDHALGAGRRDREAPGRNQPRLSTRSSWSTPVGLDYHLRAPLPSTAPAPPADELDLDGQPRPLGSLDVGADEHPLIAPRGICDPRPARPAES
jgi:hypothetical protein